MSYEEKTSNDIDPINEYTIIDITHECLIRQWVRLQFWMTQEAKSAQIYQRLLDDAKRYGETKTLLQSNELMVVLKWWHKDFKPSDTWANRYGGNFDLARNYLAKSSHIKYRNNIIISSTCILLSIVSGNEILKNTDFSNLLESSLLHKIEKEKDEAKQKMVIAEVEKDDAKQKMAIAEVEKDTAIKQRIMAEEEKDEAIKQKIIAEEERNDVISRKIEDAVELVSKVPESDKERTTQERILEKMNNAILIEEGKKLIEQNSENKNIKAYKNALIPFNKVIQNDPNNTLALYYIGYLNKQIKNYSDSKTSLQKYFKSKDNSKFNWRYYDLWANFYLGDINYEEGNLNEAIECYKKVIEINRYHELAYYRLGKIYLKSDIDKAVYYFDQHSKIRPKDDNGQYYYGVALEKQNKFEAAKDAYKKTLKINPNYTDAKRLLSRLEKLTFREKENKSH